MAMVKSDTSLTPVNSLKELLARHPAELRERYLAGTPVTLEQLEAHMWRGKMLAFEWMKHGHAVVGPMFKVASFLFFWPWTGMRFDGEEGTNIWLGMKFLRYKAEPGESQLDGKPTFKILYDEVDNFWPTKNMFDEIRLVGDELIIGATFRSGKPTIWFGLEPKR